MGSNYQRWLEKRAASSGPYPYQREPDQHMRDNRKRLYQRWLENQANRPDPLADPLTDPTDEIAQNFENTQNRHDALYRWYRDWGMRPPITGGGSVPTDSSIPPPGYDPLRHQKFVPRDDIQPLGASTYNSQDIPVDLLMNEFAFMRNAGGRRFPGYQF